MSQGIKMMKCPFLTTVCYTDEGTQLIFLADDGHRMQLIDMK